ncbi:dehydrodolichyl diphosphate synthase complex subunit DHDDS [Sabethes cyaneus]|uniref:dehydrodolichyl diphosphate synthase complex subunit DHDDS n=1 Tax=Sabethes cyaneus TaxID=53552 RepID=UPI00237D3638|nr:dehydrodolichyl diphosphate synthase complex subunit DHDDS [Sabethes cyaneus]
MNEPLNTKQSNDQCTASEWVSENHLPWYQRTIIKILKAGAIPRHVAFIMDGNRRFARKENIEKAEGHSKGFDKLSETLQWCLDIGIEEVTVYAFSIENFKRSQDEVDSLLNLAKEKFNRLHRETDKLRERGIRIRVIGNIGLLPVSVQKSIRTAVLETENNSKAFLNVAFAYTSRDEMTHSIRAVAKGVYAGQLCEDDIDEHLLEQCMYSRECSKPDLLVRTSGEVRLSDFLLWQTSSAVIYFTETLWPDFNIWHLFGAVFYYQRCRWQIDAIAPSNQKEDETDDSQSHSKEVESGKLQRVQMFLKHFHNLYRHKILSIGRGFPIDFS